MSITSNGVDHSANDLSKYPSPHFVSDTDKEVFKSGSSWWLTPQIYVDEANLQDVVREIKKYCDWLELEYQRIMSAKYA